ncbi:MAG: hypothetical protein DMF63_00460 [Acidobacteria bacterium]|nr:MAG: hypothetical protein DMF63_00460 [Acidobacteriota bacterium]
MWKSRNKTELIIEVWEKLDCENVGAVEIEAIEIAVADVFGKSAVESPMKIARLLADEGAELRHSEIMELYIARASDRPYDAAFENLIETADMRSALRSIRQMENLRRKFESEDDREGLRKLRTEGIAEKERKLAASKRGSAESAEIAEWLNIWLKSPEVFETWIKLRLASGDFKSKFGEDLKL